MLTNRQKNVFKDALGDRKVGTELANIFDGIAPLSTTVQIPFANVRTLNATPFIVLPAPGVGYTNIPLSAFVQMKYGTAGYDSVGANDDLTFKYTNAGGSPLITVETTGFLDQTSGQVRFATSNFSTAIVPVENAPIVAHILTGEIYGAAGDSDLYVKISYLNLPISLL